MKYFTETIRLGWRGEKPLWLVFWVFHIGLPLVVVIIAALILPVLPLFISTPVLFILGLSAIAYLVWCYVAIWRCAANSKYFAFLARVYVVLHIIATGGRLAATSIESHYHYSTRAKQEYPGTKE